MCVRRLPITSASAGLGNYHHGRIEAMRIGTMVAWIASTLLFGCATHATHQTPLGDQATDNVNDARAAISKNDSTQAALQIWYALLRPTGDVKVRELLASQPKGREYFRLYLEGRTDAISGVDDALAVLDKLSVARAAGVFPDTQMSDLFARLDKRLADADVSGSIPFDLNDRIDSFPVLKSPAHQQIMADRTIKNLQNKASRSGPLKALCEYVQRVGVDSSEGKRIESILPTMNIRQNEIDAIAAVFPKFAEARRAEILTRVFLQVKNGDRILVEDLRQAFRDMIRGVEWVSAPGAQIVTLTIERVRHEERTLPERSQTITTRPEGFPHVISYHYEVVSWGYEIEYGYVVTGVQDGKTVYDELVRGTIKGEYRRCVNARIQEPDGRVSRVSFFANSEMRQRCAESAPPSIDTVRRHVFSRIVEGVLKVPPIKVAHELN